jgi:hypothetical protein
MKTQKTWPRDPRCPIQTGEGYRRALGVKLDKMRRELREGTAVLPDLGSITKPVGHEGEHHEARF